MDEIWKDDVRLKLAEIFRNREEDLVRILFFLDEEDKAYINNNARPYAPQWKALKTSWIMNMDRAFKMYAERLAEDTKKCEKDQAFRCRMNKVYEQMMEHCDKSVKENEFQGFDIVRVTDPVTAQSAFGGLARAWGIIPANSKASILTSIKTLCSSKQILSTVDDVVSLGNKAGGSIVMVGLAAVYLTFEAYRNIKRWWNGKISGKRCIKNMLGATFSVAAGMAGGLGGAAVGSLLGPIGTVVGGVVGGLISAAATNYVTDRLAQKLFGLPKEESLENAYNYLGVKMTASNAEINTAFRKLCLKHHPDKGGRKQEFYILQCNMAVIKQARGDF